MSKFTVEKHNGIPALYRDGVKEVPVMYWMRELTAEDLRDIHETGIRLFTCHWGRSAMAHPFWVGENEYDFSWFDEQMELFARTCPDSWLLPRIFVSAPEWWLKKNPDECIGYSQPEGDIPKNVSFASEKWKEEGGEALRQLLRHLKSMPWHDRICGIQVAAGHCGEWHVWYSYSIPGSSQAMAKRYGAPIPPPEQRGEKFWKCYFSAGAEAIDRFCTIVKEETDYPAMSFYGYFQNSDNPYLMHLAVDQLLRSDKVDMLASPHVYSRRLPGEDAYFRAYPASLAKHGKFFIDEADDRTHLGSYHDYNGRRIMGDTVEESQNMMYRELGNAMTHCVGLWYMDIDGGMFRAPEYRAVIKDAYRIYRDHLQLPQERVSEVAVIHDPAGRMSRPYYSTANCFDEVAVPDLAFASLTRAGAPFDLYTSGDLDYETVSKYKVLVIMGGAALSDGARKELEKLKSDGRTIIWLWGAGSILNEKFTEKGIRELTQLDIRMTPEQEFPHLSEDGWLPGKIVPGFEPQEISRKFAGWRSIYFGTADVAPAKFRDILDEAGVFIYSKTDDVISVSRSAMMLLGSTPGVKNIQLPGRRNVRNLRTKELIGEDIDRFSITLKQGETLLLEMQ
ncbi:MAG: hypothetical protein E7043_00505 [Lentisphaerae bacterium]|nr:hypothetical protein [Lentisphaerota bacterium]